MAKFKSGKKNKKCNKGAQKKEVKPMGVIIAGSGSASGVCERSLTISGVCVNGEWVRE